MDVGCEHLFDSDHEASDGVGKGGVNGGGRREMNGRT